MPAQTSMIHVRVDDQRSIRSWARRGAPMHPHAGSANFLGLRYPHRCLGRSLDIEPFLIAGPKTPFPGSTGTCFPSRGARLLRAQARCSEYREVQPVPEGIPGFPI